MKKILAILIMFSLFLQCTAQFAVIAVFEIRKDYVAKYLCENRQRPEMKCHGKCCLNKQLNKVSNENSGAGENGPKVEKHEMPAFIMPERSLISVPTSYAEKEVYFANVTQMNDRLPIHSIFHPPSAAIA